MFPGPISSPAIVDQTQHRYHKGASLGIGLLVRWLVRRRTTQRGPDLKRVAFTGFKASRLSPSMPLRRSDPSFRPVMTGCLIATESFIAPSNSQRLRLD
jgi:hypothetical protein